MTLEYKCSMYTAKESNTTLIEVAGSDPWIPFPYEIKAKQIENGKLLTLVLEPAGDECIAPIAPGQYNMLYAFGVGEIPISVSSLYQDQPSLVHTIQDVGPVSKALNSFDIGDTIGVRGPFGTVWPIEKATGKDVLIMAGGVGLCPLRPVIEQILADRSSYGEVNVLYGTRNPDDIIYHQDIISWQSDPELHFLVTVDHAFSSWRGHVGVVTTLIERASFDPENTVCFICGPEVMMRFGAYGCIHAGIPEKNVYISMERNMKCAIGFCGHCQFGPFFVCKDGAVFPYPSLKPYLNVDEL